MLASEWPVFIKTRIFVLNAERFRTLAELRKEAIFSPISVRPSVCNNSAPSGRILIKVYIFVFF